MAYPTRHVRRLTGFLTNETYYLLERVAFEEIDYVIGLDIYVEETPDGEGERNRMVATHGDGRMTIYKVAPTGGSEIIINGQLSRQWAMWRADGFYLVKSGGMQQGICSLGLLPTDEALVRLSPAVKIINIKLEPAGH